MTKKVPFSTVMSKIGDPNRRTIRGFVKQLGFVHLNGTYSCFLWETVPRICKPGVFQVLRVPRKMWPTTRAGLIRLLEERCTGGR